MVDIWYTDKVAKGTGGGRKLGFPTVNLSPHRFLSELKDGVYACLVDYKNKIYKGALYFGPRFIINKEDHILEIHILNFNKTIYGENIEFKIDQYIREPVKVKNSEELISLIKSDIEKIRAL